MIWSSEHVAEKQAIARRAADIIGDGETVILDSGSTSSAMVPFLATKRDLLIITNSAVPLLLEYMMFAAIAQEAGQG